MKENNTEGKEVRIMNGEKARKKGKKKVMNKNKGKKKS